MQLRMLLRFPFGHFRHRGSSHPEHIQADRTKRPCERLPDSQPGKTSEIRLSDKEKEAIAGGSGRKRDADSAYGYRLRWCRRLSQLNEQIADLGRSRIRAIRLFESYYRQTS